MTSFATKPFARSLPTRSPRPLRSLATFGASVIRTYRAAAVYEQELAATTGRGILQEVTSGRYRTLI